MEYFIADGIPRRLVACRCLLGNLRSALDTEESSETNIDYEFITGCAERAGSHEVTTDEIGNEGYITNLAGFQNYPIKLTNGTDNPDTHLVIKARGVLQMDDDGNPLFPSIKLTLRPLSSYLDYAWLGDAGGRRESTPVNGLGENIFGEIIVDTFPPAYEFEGDLAQFLLEWNGSYDSNGCQEYTSAEGSYEAFQDAWNNNYNEAYSRFNELGAMQQYKGEFYYRVEDLPPGIDPATYAPPLKPQEIDLSLHPRADGEEAYNFRINESWDLRYRYPLWWNERGGMPYYDEADTEKWIWEPTTVLETDNPFLLSYRPNTPQVLVPVQKFLRIFSPEAFPVSPTPDPNGYFLRSAFGHQARPLHQGGQVQSVSIIRKRYPYSFDATTRQFSGSTSFYVPDFNPQNFEMSVAPPVGESFCGTLTGSPLVYSIPFQGAESYGGIIEVPETSFKCESRWRMEIQVDRDEWNFDEKLKKGWKIKGKIKFAKKLLDTTSPSAVKRGGNTNTYTNAMLSCIADVPAFPFFDESDINSYAPAGEMDFEVEVKKGNSTGEPVTVLEIPIGGTTIINGQVVQCGERPEYSINFIHDFYITEIIPPA